MSTESMPIFIRWKLMEYFKLKQFKTFIVTFYITRDDSLCLESRMVFFIVGMSDQFTL